MRNPKNKLKKTKTTLDRFSPKRGRGRPQTVIPSAIKGRADNYRGILSHVWDEVWTSLSTSATEDDVTRAFQKAVPYEREFSGIAHLILTVLKESRFPKRRLARINFLADSLAGLGTVTPRRSRDICAEERKREKGMHHIIRYEFYVVCSCGYKGPSLDHACGKCGAAIPEDWSGASIF